MIRNNIPRQVFDKNKKNIKKIGGKIKKNNKFALISEAVRDRVKRTNFAITCFVTDHNITF